jgi:hypothetical protein
MMTVDERGQYQKHSEYIVARAKGLIIPEGVTAHLGFHSVTHRWGQQMVVRVYRDFCEDVELTCITVQDILIAAKLPAEIKWSIVVTDIAEMRKIFGDGVHGKLWNYGDAPEYHPLPKVKK